MSTDHLELIRFPLHYPQGTLWYNRETGLVFLEHGTGYFCLATVGKNFNDSSPIKLTYLSEEDMIYCRANSISYVDGKTQRKM